MEQLKYYVYQLIDPRNSEPFYIGKGTGDRCNQHLRLHSLQGRSPKNSKIKAIQKLGLNVVIDKSEMMSEDAAFRLEESLIMKYGRTVDGSGVLTNMTLGGLGGRGSTPYVRSSRHRASISARRKNERRSDESRRRQSLNMSGQGNPMHGKHHSEMTRQKLKERKRLNPPVGSRNSSAKMIHIFDSRMNLRFLCHGNFVEICNANSLPVDALSTSYKNNGSRIYQTKAPTKFTACVGWSAKIVSPILNHIR